MSTPAKPKTKKTAAKAASDDLPPVTSIKGFDQDLACRGFHFAFGETYSVEGKIKACENGFHAVPIEHHPLSVFEYYGPAVSRFAEVTQNGARDADGTKLASASITIGVEISISDLVARAVKWVWDRAKLVDGTRATGDRGAAWATGTQGAASATGDRGAASATGYQGAASATGTQGAASATGDRGAASATGYQGAASATGDQGAAMSSGFEGRVKGSIGNALFAAERNDKYEIVSVACGIIGRDGIKADVWYRAKGGKLLEVEFAS